MTRPDPEHGPDLGSAPRPRADPLAPVEGARFLRRMRLVRGADYQRAYRQGARARGSALVVLTARTSGECTRLGRSIGRKAWRRAHDRNYARRLIREAFRLEYQRLPPGADLIVMSSDPKGPWNLEHLRRELVALAWRAWKKLLEREASQPPAEPPR